MYCRFSIDSSFWFLGVQEKRNKIIVAAIKLKIGGFLMFNIMSKCNKYIINFDINKINLVNEIERIDTDESLSLTNTNMSIS